MNYYTKTSTLTETEYYPDGTVKVNQRVADNNLESMPNITEIMQMFLPQLDDLDPNAPDSAPIMNQSKPQVFPQTAGHYGAIGNLAMGVTSVNNNNQYQPMPMPGGLPGQPGAFNPQMLQPGLMGQPHVFQPPLGGVGAPVLPTLPAQFQIPQHFGNPKKN